VSKKRLGNGARERERERARRRKLKDSADTHDEKTNAPQPASQPTEEEAAAAGCDAMH
jgi:hypothetical protein